MATKPASLPAWNTGGANNTEPSAGEKVSGWTVGQQPPSSYFNWWQKLTYEWTAYLDDLEAQAFTWTGIHIFQDNVSISLSDANPALNVTNTGAGSAVNGVNTSTGHGVAGGAVDAAAFGGLFVNNTNSATALKGSSTGTSSYGVHGEGRAAGVRGTGGAAGAAGGHFTGHTSGVGIQATGGATNGIGGYFTGRTNAGVYAERDDSAELPVITAAGTIDLDPATYSTIGTGFTNKLTPRNLIKAWAHVYTDAVSGPTILDGFNVNGFTVSNPGGICRLDFTDDMADTTYAVLFTITTQNATWSFPALYARTVGYVEFEIRALDTPFAAQNYAALVPGADAGVAICIQILGTQ